MVTNICWKSASSCPSISMPGGATRAAGSCKEGSLFEPMLGFFLSDSALSGRRVGVCFVGITGLFGGIGGGTPRPMVAPFFGGACGAPGLCCWNDWYAPLLGVRATVADCELLCPPADIWNPKTDNSTPFSLQQRHLSGRRGGHGGVAQNLPGRHGLSDARGWKRAISNYLHCIRASNK